MFVLIDNYDSFTYNLYHYIGSLGVEITVHRNDDISTENILNGKPQAIILSPGPCSPEQAGICLDLVKKNNGQIPILGVCLGHQTIAQAYGGHIIHAPKPVHGKTESIYITNGLLFKGLYQKITVTRYHSLIADRSTLPDCFNITAQTEDNIIMAIEHKTQPIYGVQFHPESIRTIEGMNILENFVQSVISRKKNELC
jgi:anthranilate synthase component 2